MAEFSQLSGQCQLISPWLDDDQAAEPKFVMRFGLSSSHFTDGFEHVSPVVFGIVGFDEVIKELMDDDGRSLGSVLLSDDLDDVVLVDPCQLQWLQQRVETLFQGRVFEDGIEAVIRTNSCFSRLTVSTAIGCK